METQGMTEAIKIYLDKNVCVADFTAIHPIAVEFVSLQPHGGTLEEKPGARQGFILRRS